MPDASARSRSATHIIYLIARREFVTRIRSRFFIFGTALLMALLAGYIVLQAVVINRAATTVKIDFSGGAQALAQPLKSAAAKDGVTIEAHMVSQGQGTAEVKSGKVDAAVGGDAIAPVVEVKDQLDPTVAATLDGLVKLATLNQALTASGVDPGKVEAQVANAGVQLVTLDPNAAQRTQRTVVGIFVAALLYVALLFYGQLVASGVVEEKANRIIEILLATVRAREVLFGKVVGIGLVGLLQLTLLGAAALIAETRTSAITIPNVGLIAVAGGLLWFVIGFLFYALLYAAGGSMVSRQEDLGSVTAPITFLVVGTYLAFFWVVANPDNPIGVGLSLLPPFAPVLMPARIATGDAQVWQVVVAVVLAIAAIIGLNALAARIYSNSVLKVGSRVRFVEAWRGRA
ncbi:MAG: ABC transporter permease [Candidatus Dormibacterales bacterium]